MGNNTAERWWVRSFARWQARMDASMQEINLGLRMISSGGIGSGALAYLGYKFLIIPFLLLLVLGVLAYAYIVFEHGVKNQVGRDRADMITNFAGPSMLIDDIIMTVGWFIALNGRQPTEEELEVIIEGVRNAWQQYRDGVDI